MSSSPTRISVTDLMTSGLLVIGDGYRAKNSELAESGIPFARVQNINGGFDFTYADRFPIEDLWKVGNKISNPGDVVFTSKGTVGRFALVSKDTPAFVYSPQLCFWRSLDHKRIEPRWLFYWMQSREFYSQYRSVASQTDMADYVSLRDQRKMYVILPQIEEQRAIASILGALDDKIELNRRMNATLEAMARAIFQSWFVDFDPVRAKAEGRATGLPTEIAALFPDGFVESEFGEVPQGWTKSPLPVALEVNPFRSLRKGALAPYLDMANMPTQGHSAQGVVMRPFGSGTRFMNGDTLVARITPCLENGKTAYVDFLQDGEIGWGSTEYIVLRPKEPLPTEYGYCVARDPNFRDFAIHNMTGSSGRQRVPVSSLANFCVTVPSEKISTVFEAVVRPMFQKATATASESRTLAALRDTLLPRLISGQLRLPEVAEAVESMWNPAALTP